MGDQELRELERLALIESPAVTRWIKEILRRWEQGNPPKPETFTHSFSALSCLHPFGVGSVEIQIPRLYDSQGNPDQTLVDFQTVGFSIFINGDPIPSDPAEMQSLQASIVRIQPNSQFSQMVYDHPMKVLLQSDKSNFQVGWFAEFLILVPGQVKIYLTNPLFKAVMFRVAVHGNYRTRLPKIESDPEIASNAI